MSSLFWNRIIVSSCHKSSSMASFGLVAATAAATTSTIMYLEEGNWGGTTQQSTSTSTTLCEESQQSSLSPSSSSAAAARNVHVARRKTPTTNHQYYPRATADTKNIGSSSSSSSSSSNTSIRKPCNLKSRMTSVGKFSLLSETKENPSIPVFFMNLEHNNDNNNEENKNNNNHRNGIKNKKDFIQLWYEKEMDQKHERFHRVLLSKTHPNSNKNDADYDDNDPKFDEHKLMNLNSNNSNNSIIKDTLFPPSSSVFRQDLQYRIQHLMSSPMNLYQSLWQVQISTSLPSISSSDLPPSLSGGVSQQQPIAAAAAAMEGDQRPPPPQREQNHKSKSVLLFRAHHILADGVSLGTSLLDLCDERDELYQEFMEQYQKYKTKMKQTYAKMSAFQKLFSKIIKLLQFTIASINAIVYQLYMNIGTLMYDGNDVQLLLSIVKYKYYENINILAEQKLALAKEFHGIFTNNNNHHHQFSLVKTSPSQEGDAQKKEQGNEQQQERTQSNHNNRVVSWCDVAPIDEVKFIAKTLAKNETDKITINDVFVTCITSAITKLLQQHKERLLSTITTEPLSSSSSLSSSTTNIGIHKNSGTDKDNDTRATQQQQQQQIENISLSKLNITMPVHIQGGILLPGQSMGNRIGAMNARVDGCTINQKHNDGIPPSSRMMMGVDHNSEAITKRLQKVHKTLDYLKKKTTTPLLTYSAVKLISKLNEMIPSSLSLSSSWISKLFQSAHCHSICVISNVRGPDRLLHYQNGATTVSSFYGFVPLPPGIPLGFVVSSYNGKMKLTLNAEPWIVNSTGNSRSGNSSSNEMINSSSSSSSLSGIHSSPNRYTSNGGNELMIMVLQEYKLLLQQANEKEKEKKGTRNDY